MELFTEVRVEGDTVKIPTTHALVDNSYDVNNIVEGPRVRSPPLPKITHPSSPRLGNRRLQPSVVQWNGLHLGHLP